MNDAFLIATIAAAPPTLAALLAYTSSRATQREAAADRKSGLQHTVAAMSSTLTRVEATVERVEDTVIDLRERVARLEGRPFRVRAQ